MSAVRAYLNEKAATPREWLRREPRTTHPEIQALVREALATLKPSPGGTIYDDDVERYVNERVGDLPPHYRHAHPERHALVDQLGHEVYIARQCIRDEEAAAEIVAALDAGYVPLQDADVRDGARYLVRFGTLYTGAAVAVYGEPHEVKARMFGDTLAFMPKGARTRGFDPARAHSVLVKEVRL